jgi:hypothetical protein
MNKNRLLTTALVVVMICSALAPLGTATAAADNGDDELSVELDEEEYIVTVTEDGEPVKSATVTVTTSDDERYQENETEEDGTVKLTEPEETIDVEIKAVDGDKSGLTSEMLESPEEPLPIDVTQDGYDISASITVDGDGINNTSVDVSTVDEGASYADEGTHTTDEDGTFSLEVPDNEVEVELNATVDNETETTTEALVPIEEEFENFGALVSGLVEDEKNNESDKPLGVRIAGFVVDHNPGNAPDHAGPPSHAGPPGNDSASGEQSPSAHAGPPSENDGDEENGEDDDNGQGPLSHAGNGN